jgi:hypothetical protein
MSKLKGVLRFVERHAVVLGLIIAFCGLVLTGIGMIFSFTYVAFPDEYRELGDFVKGQVMLLGDQIVTLVSWLYSVKLYILMLIAFIWTR